MRFRHPEINGKPPPYHLLHNHDLNKKEMNEMNGNEGEREREKDRQRERKMREVDREREKGER